MPPQTLSAAVLVATLTLALACRTAPNEPPPPPEPPATRAPAVHVIVQADHRNKTDLLVGDVLELPNDPDFAWTISFENGSYFDPAPRSPAGIERYKATRSGIVRATVNGDPKSCMSFDAACTIAKYAWQVTLQVD